LPAQYIVFPSYALTKFLLVGDVCILTSRKNIASAATMIAIKSDMV